MESKLSCPSCEKNNLVDLQEVRSRDIELLYKRNGIDTKKLFSNYPQVSLLHCLSCDLSFFSPAVTGDEDFYNQLQQKEWYFAHPDKTEFSYSKNFISDDYKVLDVGSGRGVLFSYIKDIKRVVYQGIEYSSKSIELAQHDNVNVIKESVQDHAVRKPAYYDVVVTFQVLEHIDKIQEFVTACLACLKPGGKFIIAVPNNEGFLKYMMNNFLNLPPHHVNHWNETSLINLGKLFNLKLIDVHKEKVTNVHKLLFYNIYIRNWFSKLFGMRYRLIDNSFLFRVTNKLIWWTSKIAIKFSKAHLKSDGHTIIIVFEK